MIYPLVEDVIPIPFYYFPTTIPFFIDLSERRKRGGRRRKQEKRVLAV
jgi:hypothetical protein